MGGYTFFQDAGLQRLPRLRYNNVPADTGGRYYCIKEPDRPAWNPDLFPTQGPHWTITAAATALAISSLIAKKTI